MEPEPKSHRPDGVSRLYSRSSTMYAVLCLLGAPSLDAERALASEGWSFETQSCTHINLHVDLAIFLFQDQQVQQGGCVIRAPRASVSACALFSMIFWSFSAPIPPSVMF